MFDITQFEIQFVGVGRGTAIFPAIVGENSTYRQLSFAIEGQDLIVQHRNGTFGKFANMEETEGIGTIGIDYRLKIHPTDSLEPANVEGVLAKQFAWPRRFNMPFAKTGIDLFDLGDLFRG